MSELMVAALKIGFLALLWVFVLIVAAVIRSDLFPRRVAQTATGPAEPTVAPVEQRSRRGRRVPTALVVAEGRQQGLRLPLGQPIDIGRSPDSTLVLDDDYCSTHHASLRPDGRGGFYVEDFGSTNGTFINDHRITGPTSLGLPDTLRIGRTTMRLVP